MSPINGWGQKACFELGFGYFPYTELWKKIVTDQEEIDSAGGDQQEGSIVSLYIFLSCVLVKLHT